MDEIELKYQAALIFLAAMTEMFYELVPNTKDAHDEFTEEHYNRFKRATKDFPSVYNVALKVVDDMMNLDYKS